MLNNIEIHSWNFHDCSKILILLASNLMNDNIYYIAMKRMDDSFFHFKYLKVMDKMLDLFSIFIFFMLLIYC
jgi:hypothetical protein